MDEATSLNCNHRFCGNESSQVQKHLQPASSQMEELKFTDEVNWKTGIKQYTKKRRFRLPNFYSII